MSRTEARRCEIIRPVPTPEDLPDDIAWFGRNRRLAKDFENLAETLAAFVTVGSIQLGLRRLARA